MGDFIFNVALGKHAYYATLPATTDSLIVVPVDVGAATDANIKDADTLDAVLALVTEQTTMGRKTLANVASTVDDTNDKVKVDADDVVWTAASGNDITDLVVCYKPASDSVDTAVIPLYFFDFVINTDGSDVTAVINTDGLAEAQ